eukprot:223355-Hanusia_phi.AAC.1
MHLENKPCKSTTRDMLDHNDGITSPSNSDLGSPLADLPYAPRFIRSPAVSLGTLDAAMAIT